MENEEKSIFDEAEISAEVPTEDVNLEDNDVEEEEWTPIVSKESPKDKTERKGTKKEMDKKVLTIASIFFTKPRTKNFDGTVIEPKKTQESKLEYYPGKLGIRFVEDNLVEYYPNFKYYINDDGKISSFAKIYRTGNNAVSNLFKLALLKIGKESEDVSDQEFYDFLIGKKVKIKTISGTYLGKTWFRNDIVEFVD